jgi:hypothetical protein
MWPRCSTCAVVFARRCSHPHTSPCACRAGARRGGPGHGRWTDQRLGRVATTQTAVTCFMLRTQAHCFDTASLPRYPRSSVLEHSRMFHTTELPPTKQQTYPSQSSGALSGYIAGYSTRKSIAATGSTTGEGRCRYRPHLGHFQCDTVFLSQLL